MSAEPLEIIRPQPRFRRRVRGWWVSAALLVALTAISLIALPVSLRWNNVQNLGTAVRHPPSIHPAALLEQFERGTAHPPWSIRAAHSLSSLLGHDDLGRSLLYRLLPAFLLSLAIGLAAAAMSVVLGTLWGATAAMAGGRVDLLMMRFVDVLYGLPYILMVILLKIALTRPLTALLGGHTKLADFLVLLVAIGGVSWLTMARVIRGQVLALRQLAFVEAARAAGASPLHILRSHLLPNLVGPIVVYATLVMPQAILQESFLSFLGIGIQQPTPSLGNLAADGVHAVNLYVDYWWLIVFPCGLLALTLLALNFLGDALRDAHDPRSSASTWL
jgi:oligopeptide transport system permease protein